MEGLESRDVPASLNLTVLGDITEGGSAASFRFTRSDNTDTFSVGFTTTGTASGLDYSYMPMVTFTAGGSLTADLSITPTNDSNIEGTETIIITLVPNPPYYSSNGSATMNLFDDDTPQVTVAKIGSDPTEGGTGTFRISRTGPTTSSLGVTFTIGGTATEGTDFDTIGTSVSIPANSASVDVTVTSRADNSVEGGETVTIDIADGKSSYTAINATANLTIADDPPVISISAANAAENASGAFTFTRTGGKTADALTVNYTVTGGTATSGTDFTALSGSVSIAAGKSSADVTLSALPDNLVEGDETVIVTIGSGSYTIGTSAATATITDDPPVVSVSRLNDGTEGGSNGAFRVSRTGGDTSAALVVTYTVAGTANPSSNTDYTALSGTVTIAASASYADITVTVTNDGSVESAETVILTLDTDTDWVNGSPTATLFIWDNDGTYIEWEGDESDSWMDPDNWVGGNVPGSSDTAVFSGTTTYDPILSGPLSPVVLAGLVLEAGFTGVITLEFPIEVGSLQMAGGTLDQPYSAYGSNVTITGAALWAGGVLNSTANAAEVIFDGATAVITGTLYSASTLIFVNAIATFGSGTLSLTEGTGVAIAGSSIVAFAPGSDAFVIAAADPTKQYILNKADGKVAYSGKNDFELPFVNLGEAKVHGYADISFDGELYDNNLMLTLFGIHLPVGSIWVGSGKLIIESGSTLTGVNGTSVWGGSLIADITPDSAISRLVGPLWVNGGQVEVRYTNSAVSGVYGVLRVDGAVSWSGGKYLPVIDNNNSAKSSLWYATGTITISGTREITPYRYNSMTVPPANRTWDVLQSADSITGSGTPVETDGSYTLVPVGTPVNKYRIKQT